MAPSITGYGGARLTFQLRQHREVTTESSGQDHLLFRLTYLRMMSPTLRSSDQSVSRSSRSLWWVETDRQTDTTRKHTLLPTLPHWMT